MPRFSVVLPAHEQAETLPYSVQSVLGQTVQDFELIIAGDGATEPVREVAARLAASDPRIRFFDLPKGEQRGESNRRYAVARALGELICYQTDDDLWFPTHLETMGLLLADADLAQTGQVIIAADGRPSTFLFDATQFADAAAQRANVAGISVCATGHRRAAHERLPERWPAVPPGRPAGAAMLNAFFDQPWLRYASHKWPTTLRCPAALRPRASGAERAAENARWLGVVRDDRARDALCATVMREVAEHLYRSLRTAESALNKTRLERLACTPQRLRELERDLAAFHAVRRLPPLEYACGTTLRFDRFGAGQRYVMAGFAKPEAWGTWIDGRCGELVVPLAAAEPVAHELTLTYRCLVHDEHSPEIRFRVSAGDDVVADVAERSAQTRSMTLTLPLPRPAPVPHYYVRIDVDNPLRPASTGLSPDERSLGVGLESLVIERTSRGGV